jgi:DNA-binding SARP family transcriptional activator
MDHRGILVSEPRTDTAAHRGGGRATSLHLLDGFGLLVSGRPVALAPSCQRLLAYLALHEHALMRPHVAGMLWGEANEERAMANLRSSLWRIHRLGGMVVTATTTHLSVGAGVEVDVNRATATAHRILGDGSPPERPGDALRDLTGDVLPDWYEDWVSTARERHRQVRLHALEALAEHLLAARNFAGAIEAAMAAVAAEPLRESAHLLVIRIHLVEGNRSEALRQFELCRRLLDDELGLQPSDALVKLVRTDRAQLHRRLRSASPRGRLAAGMPR